ncbi:Metallo-dependent phosphatase [Gautieria morchelliformis]|nr:Metallo-dependent phosphatase [Gautieria morchelliformis]
MTSPGSVTAPNVAVHLSYESNKPPPHPGPQWTRFVCLSDTHSKCFAVPPGDVLLHSGDLSSFGRVGQLKVTMDWINDLPHPIKVPSLFLLICAYSLQLSLDSNWYENNWPAFHRQKENAEITKSLMIGDEARHSHVIYLEYSSVEIQAKHGGRKWKVYGSPGTPWFGGWAFNYERGQEAQSCFPHETVSLTHGPPVNVLDTVHNGTHAGCIEMMRRLEEIRPTLHVFGHIHEDRGVKVHPWSPPQSESGLTGRHQTIFVNAANMPSGRKAAKVKKQGVNPVIGGPGFQPILVDLFDPVDGADV